MKFSSSDVIKRANTTKKALRHYNKMGLLTPIIEENGYWYYEDGDLTMLQLIQTLQIMGFTLREIKLSIDSDFDGLRESIIEKRKYVQEQLLQLSIASNLIDKVEKKENLSPYEAILASYEEEHLEWYKDKLPKEQYELVIGMLNSPESGEDHNQLMIDLSSFKELLSKKKDVKKTIERIKAIFSKHDISGETVNIVLESFIKANLEGPLSQRLLSVSEAAVFLDNL